MLIQQYQCATVLWILRKGRGRGGHGTWLKTSSKGPAVECSTMLEADKQPGVPMSPLDSSEAC